MQTQPFAASPVRWVIALGAGSAVFLFVIITTMLVTFILPKSYASTARVLLTPGNVTTTNGTVAATALGTQIELMKSELVLGRAAAELGLAEEWGRKYGGPPLHGSEVLEVLRPWLEIRQVSGTSLAEIKCVRPSPNEAARIANQIAATYCEVFGTNTTRIVDRATPSLEPAWPNTPLNIIRGVIAGLLLGGLIAGAVLFFTRAKRRSVSVPTSSSRP